jgi:hypothetical protein
VLLWRMSTLSEMEAAVDALSTSDQESLLEHLARKLGTRQPVTDQSRAKRERWLRKLDQLRARGSTGKTGVPLQEILDDVRSEPR